MNPANFEAFCAKAKANREDGRLHSALNDLMNAAKYAPKNRDVYKNILHIKARIEEEEKKKEKLDREQLASMAMTTMMMSTLKTDSDSTSGVDSSGSKDMDTDMLTHTVVI